MRDRSSGSQLHDLIMILRILAESEHTPAENLAERLGVHKCPDRPHLISLTSGCPFRSPKGDAFARSSVPTRSAGTAPRDLREVGPGDRREWRRWMGGVQSAMGRAAKSVLTVEDVEAIRKLESDSGEGMVDTGGTIVLSYVIIIHTRGSYGSRKAAVA